VAEVKYNLQQQQWYCQNYTITTLLVLAVMYPVGGRRNHVMDGYCLVVAYGTI
jgi:hypothetical protein